MKKRYSIEQVYKVHIEYDFDDFEKKYSLSDFIFKKKPKGIEIAEEFNGNAAFNPHFILESKDETELNLFINQVLDYAESSLGGFEIIG